MSLKKNSTPQQRRLLIGNGHDLVEAIVIKRKMVPPPPPREYDEARGRIVDDLTSSIDRLRSLPSNCSRPDEFVFCLRLHPDMLAKTYDPENVFAKVPALQNVGSRPWRAPLKHVKSTDKVKALVAEGKQQAESRMIFVRTSDRGIEQFLGELNRPESSLDREFKRDIQKIERFDLLEAGERLQGFEKWIGGRVELVFHPTRELRDQQMDFLGRLFDGYEVNISGANLALYKDGPSFVSIPLQPEALAALKECNPLRAAHPLSSIELRPIRSSSGIKIPPPPSTSVKSSIVVGIFDGGIDVTIPALAPFVDQDNSLSVESPEVPGMVAHGSAVAGAVLYGSLDQYVANSPLPTPKVSVTSFRVLPGKDPNDEDLYEVIATIEKVVHARPDIRTFNISLGPQGPILDDQISRFTFALDRLAAERGVGFICAAGNDGDIVNYDRIQSPSDMVHGSGVGAYTLVNQRISRAPYSCRGPGREGAKVKPDFLAFGGCDQQPFHLVSTDGGRAFACGTSFSAPHGARLHALVRGIFDQSSSLLARVLMTHASRHDSGSSDNDLGWGILPNSWEELLYTEDGSVTVVFQGHFSPGKFNVLPIPIPPNLGDSGEVAIAWTIGALSPLDVNHPGDYTTCCIEDHFHPDSRLNRYSKKDPITKKSVYKEFHDVRHAEIIAKLGPEWKKSKLPSTTSPRRSEAGLRSHELKWDTLVKRSVVKRAVNLHRPSLILHSMQRRQIISHFDYAAAVTISAHKFTGDLFTEILRAYPRLQPIRVRTEAEVMIPL